MKQITGSETTREVAARMKDGTSAATVNRWQKGARPTADKVITLCRAYHHDPIAGLHIAGYLTEDELKRPHISSLTTAELLAELDDRTKQNPPKPKRA